MTLPNLNIGMPESMLVLSSRQAGLVRVDVVTDEGTMTFCMDVEMAEKLVSGLDKALAHLRGADSGPEA